MISSLVTSPNERGGGGGLMSSRAVGRVGQAVNVAVDRFVTVGETIADDNPEIKVDMYEACKEARAAGLAIEKLCETAENTCERPSPVGIGGCATGIIGGGVSQEYRASMIRAARCLLSSVTRVLLLADTVVVKQLLLTKDKVSHSLSRLESVTNFTEFVKAFSQFGGEMVELAQLTCERHTDLKDERRRAQMAAARQVLDRSTMMLLTASKVCLRHPECMSSRENRDTVFCQMRRAMDLIHYVVKDGVLDAGPGPSELRMNGQSLGDSPSRQEDWDSNHTVYGAIKHLEESVEMTRMTFCGPAVRERLCQALDTIGERSQDFTDSAYTSHEHRQTILLLTERIRLELNHLLRVGISLEQREIASPSDDLESAIATVAAATKELKKEFQNTALEQASEIIRGFCEESELVSALKNSGLATDQERLDEYADRFLEHIEHIQEVCKLLRHVATTDSLQVAAKYGEINLRIYGPQVVTAAQTLCLYPTSKIAKENVEVFADMWLNLVGDVKSLTKDVGDTILAENKPPEKQVYMSLPRPGKHGTTTKPPKPTKLDQEEQAKLAKSGLDMKMISSEVDQEAEKWEERITQDEDNDIVKRAKNMSSMAFSMYQFTRGEGALKTTQDLFTQGEYFAEEANRLYKVVRQFSYQVPAGPQKKELMEHLDHIPTHVQSLQFTVKNSTVGKAATFTKVDNVIQETKNLMNVISKVVTTCFVCATKFKLKLPERLQLPTLDDCSAGIANPFGQVEICVESSSRHSVTSTTTSVTSKSEDEIFYIKPMPLGEIPSNVISESLELHTTSDCADITPLKETPPHTLLIKSSSPCSETRDKCSIDSKGLQDLPVAGRVQPLHNRLSLSLNELNNSLVDDNQTTISNLQKILDSLALNFIQTQKSLEPLLEIQRTIQFLKNLNAKKDKEDTSQEFQFHKGIEVAISNLHKVEGSKDVITQDTIKTTIQTLQNLQLNHVPISVKRLQPKTLQVQIPHEFPQIKKLSESNRESIYTSTQSLTSDNYPSLFTQALLDSQSLPLLPEATKTFTPNYPPTFDFSPSSNTSIPSLYSLPKKSPEYNNLLHSSHNLGVSPNSMSSLSPNGNASQNLSSLSNLSPYSLSPQVPLDQLDLSSSLCPSFVVVPNLSPIPISSLQYLDLQSSIMSPMQAQLASAQTNDILKFLPPNRNFSLWPNYTHENPVSFMSSTPIVKNISSNTSTLHCNVPNFNKGLNFSSLSS